MRRGMQRSTFSVRSLFVKPELFRVTLVATVFLIITSVLIAWSREQLRVYPGQVMSDTRIKRLDFEVPDYEQTERRRDAARSEAPLVYTPHVENLEQLRSALMNLPIIVAPQSSVDDVVAKVRAAFELDDQSIDLLREYAFQEGPKANWKSWVTALVDTELLKRPLIDSGEWQLKLTMPTHPILRDAEGNTVANWVQDPIHIAPDAGERIRQNVREVVLKAGFPEPVAKYVTARIVWDPRPTFMFSETATHKLAEELASQVQMVREVHSAGEVMFRRGDSLSEKQLSELQTETASFAELAPWIERWTPRVAVVGLMMIITTCLAGYLVLFYPRITRNWMRVLAVCSLMAGMLAASAFLSREAPTLLFPLAIGPALLVAIVVLLAYDQRLAMFLSLLQCLLITFALDQRIGMLILIFAACGAMIIQLREVRHRHTLIRASAITAAVVFLGAILLGLLRVPNVEGATQQIFGNAMWSGVASFSVGFIVLGILPTIERTFEITTGMTLAELRDPKQPLLRQLQQRAPGTYNHSLQVANIAETAADAIGADSLLVYVGSLYHDIGKMSKPDYFVENQSPGQNRHAKLRPAMSLLVIVGHVKDGMELAREYSLPRALQHFIEGHHGTTLVEYFYHAAKTQAAGEHTTVQEVEYRYPGPKPRTKEVAILMLCDAVESATRAMAEPNPARIESLVRQLSKKRLMDSQFDECDLTFRELRIVEDSIIKSMCAVYHSRISYPAGASGEPVPRETPPQPPQPQRDPARSISA